MTPTLPRIAVAGCGHWGRNLVRVLDDIGALSAVHDPDPARAHEVVEGRQASVSEWEQILASDVDGIVIAAPAAEHAGLARESLAAGKHTFVEKPLALDVADAERLCREADDRGRVLMVGHLLRYHPVFLKLSELVESGVLGKVQYLYSNRLNLGRFRQEENILWSFAPHDISMILDLVGEDPLEVSAVGGWYLSEHLADVTTTHLAFPGGVRAHVFVSWLHPYKEHRLVVVGDEGMAVFDDGRDWVDKLRLFRHRVDTTGDGPPEALRAEPEAVPVDPSEPLLAECRHFLHCVGTGVTPITDGREGVRVLRVLAEAEQSLAENRP